MLSLSNTLSLLRVPLAFVLLIDNTTIRLLAIFLAMCSDCLDGHLARRRKTTSQFGAILDPLMDKFFVYFALVLFVQEDRLHIWEACAMISRDFFLFLFALYLSLFQLWKNYRYKSIRWGKISTSLQFITLIVLAFGIHVPSYLFTVFIVMGMLAFVELYHFKHS